jgi:ABC-type uncharacterized transport system auxiliary subunit
MTVSDTLATITRRAGLGALLGAGVALGGCISLLPDPGDPDLVGDLTADPSLARARVQLPVTVGIGLPLLTRMHGGNQIVVVEDNGGYAYLTGVRLAANSGITIQSLILSSFDRVQPVRSVVRSLTVARPDYDIHFDMSRFDVTLPEGRATGTARITGTARLMVSLTGRLIASREFTAEAPARRGGPLEAVRGLEAATRRFSAEVMDWSVGLMRAELPQMAPAAAAPAAASTAPAPR